MRQAIGNRAASSGEKGRGGAGGRHGLVARGGNSEGSTSEGNVFAGELRATARALCGLPTAPLPTAPLPAAAPLLPALPPMRPEALVAVDQLVDAAFW